MLIPFSTPEAFRAITKLFEVFCRENSITVLSRCTVRHWCWEWSGCTRGSLNRYLTILAMEEPAANRPYIVEFWAEADNDSYFTRQRVLRKKFARHHFDDTNFQVLFNNAISACWSDAQQLTARNLTHSYESHTVRMQSRPSTATTAIASHEGEHRLLVVDDTLDSQATLHRAFQAGGYSVMVARDASEAVQMASIQKPDALVIDLMMPSMSGLEIVKKIREGSGSESLPAIIISALEEDKSELESLQSDYDYYLSKPFKPEELLKRIEHILSGRSL